MHGDTAVCTATPVTRPVDRTTVGPVLPTPRARVFGSVAVAYAEHRPLYPPDAVAWAVAPIADRPAPEVLDLAAGTGQLTRSLPASAQVTAVEPDPGMLAELHRRLPGVRALTGSAESIPLPDVSVDAVVVGTAWHWFDPLPALAEIARVLRPGGVLAVVWNGDDASVDWVAGYHEAAARGRPVPSCSTDVDDGTLPPHPAFVPPERARFPNPSPTTVDGLLSTLATHSWALLSTPADREAAFDRIRGYLATHPATENGEFVLPMVTDVLRAVRLS